MCDALATALVVADDDGPTLARSLGSYDAYIIRSDGSEYNTEGVAFASLDESLPLADAKSIEPAPSVTRSWLGKESDAAKGYKTRRGWHVPSAGGTGQSGERAVTKAPVDSWGTSTREASGAPAAGPSRTAALLIATRPRQWVKNLLVLAAPTAAGTITSPAVAARSAVAFVVFVAASAATYLVNDVVDREADKLHPVKRSRPLATGQVSPRLAISVALALGVSALATAEAVSGGALVAVVGAYLVISVSYSIALKKAPVLELACVAAGFTLRAVAGGAAAHIGLSPWFLMVASFGSLFVVAGKRSVEQSVMRAAGKSHRSTLAAYPTAFLRSLRTLAMSVTVTTYCLWAFERAGGLSLADRAEDIVWFELSIVPFVLAVFFVELAIEQGRGGEPEELALKDRGLQVLGLAWVVLLCCGIFA